VFLVNLIYSLSISFSISIMISIKRSRVLREGFERFDVQILVGEQRALFYGEGNTHQRFFPSPLGRDLTGACRFARYDDSSSPDSCS
jgi:hypothetical protein